MFRTLAIAATLLGLTAAAQADVWRFVDAQGHVQYSDRWVPGSVLIKTDHATQDPSASNSSETSDQQKLNASNTAIAGQQEQNAAQQQVRNDVQKVKDEDCKRLTAEYEKAIQARRIYKDSKDGQRTYVSDAEADAYRLDLFNKRKQACGK
ncbi:MAG TPA: DUF4124 domain-containing protein [Steroidobacteraceae bacterium]|jgi:hypothetical protein